MKLASPFYGIIACSCVTMLACSTANMKGMVRNSQEVRMLIAENECFPKGQLGIINQDLYIVLNSKNNELILKNGERWIGADSWRKQVVFVSGQEVVEGVNIPSAFTLEKHVIVSFEGYKVSFFDFRSGVGGFYRRKTE